MSRNSVIFLDRDGVINHDSSDYVKHWREFHFIPGSIEGICNLTRAGFDIFIATNQSGIARKLIAPSDLEEMHNNLIERLQSAGGKIKDIFFCPHHPKEHCLCRKPLPGLLFAAQKKYALDLSTAVMVGDSTKDITCGQNAGLSKTILVQTGNGRAALDTLTGEGRRPDHVAPDLFHAAQWIITHVL